jgi:ribosomal protein S18 acetylase RimI-like enzyme
MPPDLQPQQLDLQLRRLRSREWRVLRDVRLNALRESPQSFLARYAQEKKYGKKRWRSEFGRGDWIVGKLDGRPVCLTGVTRESGAPPDQRYLEYVWVAPNLRRQRVAFGMLTDVIGKLQKSGVRTVFLWILDGNDPAQLLYKQLDFITTNQRMPLDADPERCEERLRRDLV